MRSHRLGGRSATTNQHRKSRNVSSIIPLLLLVVFSTYNALDGIARPNVDSVPRDLDFWKGFQEKLDSLETYARLHPEEASAQYRYGRLCLKGLRTAGSARDAFRKAIALKTDFAEAHNGLGWAYLDLWGMRAALSRATPRADLEQAAEAFKLAIELKSGYSDAYLGLGCAYMQMSLNAKALECLQRVIELDPNNAEGWHLLSGTYEALAQYQEAINANLPHMLFSVDESTPTAISCRHYLPEEHFHDDYLDLIRLGSLYEKAGQYDAAIQVYNQALKRNPDEPQGYHHLGLAYFAKGDKGSALAQYYILQNICWNTDPENACDHFAEDLINRLRVKR